MDERDPANAASERVEDLDVPDADSEQVHGGGVAGDVTGDDLPPAAGVRKQGNIILK